MRKSQRRKSDFMVKRQLGSAAYPQFKGIGAFPNKQKWPGIQKACKLLDELEKVGVLERKRQGLGRPNKLYLKKMF